MSRNRIMNRIRGLAFQENTAQKENRLLFTRRQALKMGALGMAGLAFPLPSWSRRLRASRHIAVVGAGIAGLTAALVLNDHGFPCSVFESSHRLGGRIHSNRTLWQQGQVSEWCGEFIDTQHLLIRSLARRFRLTLADIKAAYPSGSQDTNYFLGSYYSDDEVRRDMATVLEILNQQYSAIGPVVSYDKFNHSGYRFDHLNAHDWIESYVPGGHGSRFGLYLDLGLASTNGLETTQQSSLNLLLGGSSDERFRIQNGNQQLTQRIASRLPAGTIQTGKNLAAIDRNAEKVNLRFSTPSTDESETFDYVILALPFSVLRRLNYSNAGFDQLKETAIKQLGYGTNSKLVLQFDDKYWNKTGPWPGVSDGVVATDLPIQQTWDSTIAQPGTNGLLTNYTNGSVGASYSPDRPYTTTNDSEKVREYASALLDQLEIVLPGIGSHYNGLAMLSYPTGDPNLRGSYSCYKVGQYTGFSGYEKVRQGRIHFAGEHTSFDFQGFMEGGAHSGKRAAMEILEEIN